MMKHIKIFFALLMISLSVFLSGCWDIPDEVILPEWDVDLNVPLMRAQYTLDSIVGSQQYTYVNPVDSLFYVKTKKFEQGENLLDFIKIDQAVTLNNININPLNAEREVFIEFRSDSVDVDSAVFETGYININVRNNSSVTVHFIIKTPGILKEDSPVTLEFDLQPGESGDKKEDLSECKYKIPSNQPPVFKNQFWVHVQTSANGINVGDEVEFDIELSDFYFSSLSGRFPTQNIGKKSTVHSMNVGEDMDGYRDKLKLKEASILIEANYQTLINNPFQLKIDSLTISGTRRNGERIYVLDSTGSRYFNILIENHSKSIELNHTNSNIADLLTFIPENIEYEASYYIIGNNQAGTITKTDSIKFNTSFSTKSMLAVARSTLKDTVDIIVKEDERIDIQNVLSADVVIEIENRIPLNCYFRLTLMDSLYNPLFDILDNGTDSIFVEGAKIDPTTGKVVSSSLASLIFKLPQEDIHKLSRSYYFLVSTSVETSSFNPLNPPLVELKASDWIKVLSYGNLRYNVDPEEE